MALGRDLSSLLELKADLARHALPERPDGAAGDRYRWHERHERHARLMVAVLELAGPPEAAAAVQDEVVVRALREDALMDDLPRLIGAVAIPELEEEPAPDVRRLSGAALIEP
ncbi:hypothetical protein [Streptomyces sp. NPDC017435]|uniref:hypothetical protein n=1 Tax=Streptomyces sp. NPDC017435 TaxID=3364995 RepID=UPI003791F8FA